MEKQKLTDEQLEQLRSLPIGKTMELNGAIIRCATSAKQNYDGTNTPCDLCLIRHYYPQCIRARVCFSYSHVSGRSVHYLKQLKKDIKK